MKLTYWHTVLNPKNRTVSFEGWVMFDTERRWAVKEWVTTINKATRSRKIEFASENVGDYPPPAKITHVVESISGRSVEIATFDPVRKVDLPKSAFRLPAFNLPEPRGYEGPRPLKTILAIAAAVCALLFLFFGWRARRKAQAARTGPTSPLSPP